MNDEKAVSPPSSVMWHPIETAPKDNKHPLYLAQFNIDTGELIELDWDAAWEAESESWEMPQVYYTWCSANGRVEEPTHWAYQNASIPQSAYAELAVELATYKADTQKLREILGDSPAAKLVIELDTVRAEKKAAESQLAEERELRMSLESSWQQAEAQLAELRGKCEALSTDISEAVEDVARSGGYINSDEAKDWSVELRTLAAADGG